MKKIASIGLAVAIGFGGMLSIAAPAQAASSSYLPYPQSPVTSTVKQGFNEGWKKQGCGNVNLKTGKLRPMIGPGTNDVFKKRFWYSQLSTSTKDVYLLTNNKATLNNKAELKKVGAQTCYYHLVYSTYGAKSANSQLLKKFNSKTMKYSSHRGSGVEKAVLCMGKARGVQSFIKNSGSCTKTEIANANKILKGKKA